jgi:hypothetical protein
MSIADRVTFPTFAVCAPGTRPIRRTMRAGRAKRYSSTFRRYRTLPEGAVAARGGQYTRTGMARRSGARPVWRARARPVR